MILALIHILSLFPLNSIHFRAKYEYTYFWLHFSNQQLPHSIYQCTHKNKNGMYDIRCFIVVVVFVVDNQPHAIFTALLIIFVLLNNDGAKLSLTSTLAHDHQRIYSATQWQRPAIVQQKYHSYRTHHLTWSDNCHSIEFFLSFLKNSQLYLNHFKNEC